MRALHDSNPASACLQALTSAPVLQENGLDDVRAQMRASWLAAAEEALASHRSTVGAVPIDLLLDSGPDGVLATFTARGYRVLGPDDVDEGVVERVGDDADPARESARIDSVP